MMDSVIHVKRFVHHSANGGDASDQINRSLLSGKSSKQDTLCILKANITAKAGIQVLTDSILKRASYFRNFGSFVRVSPRLVSVFYMRRVRP